MSTNSSMTEVVVSTEELEDAIKSLAIELKKVNPELVGAAYGIYQDAITIIDFTRNHARRTLDSLVRELNLAAPEGLAFVQLGCDYGWTPNES
jgi:hypothetical protein